MKLGSVFFCLILACFTQVSAFEQPAEVKAQPVDFTRDIQPILAEHCTHCHGADESSRKASLRLDDRSSALKGGDSGLPAIIAGDPKQSSLIVRIHSTDAAEVMPPTDQNKPLSAQQKELLSLWIAQGAPYAAHWAFTAPKKPTLSESDAKHAIDQLVARKLAAVGLTGSLPASKATLCRRLYLDLIGLPPSPDDVANFEREDYSATVKRLLSSERYGEKWARHWLDVARYSDTNGYEKDLRRDQWAWRDWVVDSFNKDLPYNQFLVEQIAGDLLPNATPEQVIATGFLRNSMLNEEGAIIPEQFRMFELFDRMDCIGKSVLGLTTQCAQCHSHKFDPLSQDEYYGMFSFLNNAFEAQSWVYNTEQQKQVDEVKESIRTVEERLKQSRPEWSAELAKWTADTTAKQPAWSPVSMTQLESISGLNHPVQLADKSILMLGHTSADIFFVGAPDLEGVTGLQLEVLNHGDLPFGGPGRSSLGTWGILEVEVLLRKPGSNAWEKQKLVNATADFSETERKGEGKKVSGPVGYLIDGQDDTAWQADRGIGRRNQPSVAVVQFERPLDVPSKTELKFVMRMNNMVGCCRISTTCAATPSAQSTDCAAVVAAAIPHEQRTVEQQSAVFTGWRKSLPDAVGFNEEIDRHWSRFPQAMTSVLHLAERPIAFRRETQLLDRGEWDRPKQAVKPGTPKALHPIAMPERGEPDRLSFARWLSSADSPLTARVAVNRVWQAIFGEGLVETAEDFGTRAPVPEHLELLDWLAVDFMEHGWSQKHLIETIVTSSVYQQDSKASPESLLRDPKNRLLSRGPRFRCEAEVIRDIALAVSGLMTHKRGGPSVVPPVPQNVLDYNYVYPAYWTPAQGPDRYRRTLYGFRKRSMPDPVMSNFDAPNGDMSCARRIRSNTPLAALTGLNETIFVEAARALAIRVLREGGSTDVARTNYAFKLCTGREPQLTEQQEVLNLLQSQRKRLSDGWLNPRDVTTGDATKLPELPPASTPQDAAAWTLTARVLLNLDETISKN